MTNEEKTNEEKAKEICDAYANSKFIPTPEECVAYSSAMTMAEWKDKQYAKAFAPILIELDELKHQVKSLLP